MTNCAMPNRPYVIATTEMKAAVYELVKWQMLSQAEGEACSYGMLR